MMGTIQYPVDYEGAIVTLIRELLVERAAQLYDFARFLLGVLIPKSGTAVVFVLILLLASPGLNIGWLTGAALARCGLLGIR